MALRVGVAAGLLLCLKPARSAVPTFVLSTTNIHATDLGDREVTLGPWESFLTGVSPGTGDTGQVLDNPIVCDLDEPGSKMLKDPPVVRIDDPCAPAQTCQRTTAAMTFTPAPNVASTIDLPATGLVMCTMEDSAGEQNSFNWTITLLESNSPPSVSILGGSGWQAASKTLSGINEDNSADSRSPDLSVGSQRTLSTVSYPNFFSVSPSTPADEPEQYQFVETVCVVTAGVALFHDEVRMVSAVGDTTQKFEFILAKDQSGSAQITCTHTDGDAGNPSFVQAVGQSTTTTFTMEVTEVNDLPTATVLKTPVIATESKQWTSTTAVGVASLLPGPVGATENTVQTVCSGASCPCSVGTPGLFKVLPKLDSDGSVTFTPEVYQAGTSSVTCTVRDNGSPQKESTVKFDISITENNDPPRATVAVDPVIVDEDSETGVAGINVLTDVYPYFATSSSETAQTISSVNCDSDQPALFRTDGPLAMTVPSQGGVGKLTFGLRPNVNTERSGDATVTCTIYDSVTPPAFTAVRFKLRVRPVNDPPVVSMTSTVVVAEEGQQRIVENFIAATAGPDNELDQNPLQYSCSTSRPEMFVGGDLPRVSQDGTLSFVPGAGVSGDAPVTCAVSDSGPSCPQAGAACLTTGTCGRCSTTVNFTIRIQVVNTAPIFTLLNQGRVVVAQSGQSEAARVLSDLSPGSPVEVQQGQTVTTACGAPTQPTYFSGGANSLPTLGTDGVLRFTTAAGVSGTTTVRCVVSDTATPPLSKEALFTIAIGNAVGNGAAPTCRLFNPDLVVTAPVGVPTTVPNFMEIAAGGADAAQQQLRVACAPDSPEIFQYPDQLKGQDVGVGEDPVALTLRGFQVTASLITSAAGSSPMRCTVTDGAGRSSTCSFMVNSQVGGTPVGSNQAPVVSPRCAVITAGRASGPQTVNNFLTMSPGAGEAATQAIASVSCSAAQTGLFSALNLPGADTATGTLRFTPSGQLGTTGVVCTATDNGSPAAASQVGFSIMFVDNWNGRLCPNDAAPPGPVTNTPPCFPLGCSAAVNPVTAGCGTGTVVRDSFVQNWSPGAGADSAGQFVTTTCNTPRTDLFLPGGMPTIDANGRLTFTPAGSGTGRANVQCTATDNGAPPQSTSFTFDVDVSCTTSNCVVSGWSAWGVCSATCGGGTQTRTRTVVTGSGTACPALSETQPCNTQGCTVVPIPCTVSAWGAWGQCSATCGGGTQARTRTITRAASNGGTACPPLQDSRSCNTQGCTAATPVPVFTGSSLRWLRMVLRQPIGSFRRKAFEDAVQRSVSGTVLSMRLMWVCPDTACPGLVCPTTNGARSAAGCQDASQVFWEHREAEPLQLTPAGGDETIVDFDMPWTGDSSLSPQQARQHVLGQLTTAVTACNAGQACNFPGMSPVVSSLAPSTTDGDPPNAGTVNRAAAPGSGGSDGMSTGVLVAIILCSILFVCCLLVLLYLLMRSKKGSKKDRKSARREDAYSPSQGTRAGSEYDMKSQPQPISAPSGETQPYRELSVPDGALPPGEMVTARYDGDGNMYQGTVHSYDPDGTYTVNWDDGTHSKGVHPLNVQRLG
eukprot:TRINITY_DN3437_c0_g1_i1.p1 TRINITY_DN3437_c0_g1~~TRINITY_DN3437_c0_g1_i1.p1  ORF type:complete len:1567 (+),score=470.06 TRINITY_DN3437_c0_g1_i1:61-4761(+)